MQRLIDFVTETTRAFDTNGDEAILRPRVARLLEHLVAQDDWLASDFAEPDPDRYRQYLLYRDPRQRFSLVSFVWGPGQSTPVHDHTVWGLIGVLRGAELSQHYEQNPHGLAPAGPEIRLDRGQVDFVSPSMQTDIHRVRNAYDDRVSVSIHLYAGDIGTIFRHVFDPRDGTRKTFISGYANTAGPTLPS